MKLNEHTCENDELLEPAIAWVLQNACAKIAPLQVRFRISYPRAARLVATMEAMGIISAADEAGERRILAHLK